MVESHIQIAVYNQGVNLTYYIGIQKKEKKGLNSEVAGLPFRCTVFYVCKHMKKKFGKNFITV